MSETIRTIAATVEICEGLLVYTYDDGAVVDEEVAQSALSAGARLATDGQLPTLVLMAGVRRVTRAARLRFASEDNRKISSQVALVVGSPLTRMIGSFILALSKTEFPTRVFDDAETARAWLREGGR